jgi:hypothetical protein
METNLPDTIQKRIEDYKNLKLGNTTVVTPYFINDKRKRDLRAMVGKGTPEEIIMEARIWEKLKGADFSKMSNEEIKQFLIDRALGIDCSGFIVHILNQYFLQTKHKPLWDFLKIPNKSFGAYIKYKLRPVEQLGASIITNLENCSQVNLSEVQVMDLIRSKSIKLNGDHIMIVSQVNRDDNGNLISLKYTHSTPHYGQLNGVKTGEIKIIDINKPLEEQDWLEVDENGVCHSLEGYSKNIIDNGIRRLKSL